MVKYGAWFEKRMEFLEIRSTSKYVSWHYILMSPSAGCGEIMQCLGKIACISWSFREMQWCSITWEARIDGKIGTDFDRHKIMLCSKNPIVWDLFSVSTSLKQYTTISGSIFDLWKALHLEESRCKPSNVVCGQLYDTYVANWSKLKCNSHL